MAKEALLKVRIADDLVARIDAFADAEFVTRSEAVRELVTRGLAFGRKVLTAAETRKLLADLQREGLRGA